MAKILREKISVTGCGRTDTGVHASHFVAHFDREQDLISEFLHRINSVLPNDIAIHAVFNVPDDFNARFDAKSRTYLYHVLLNKDVFRHNHAYLFHRQLDLKAMQVAAEVLCTYNEFGAFCKSNAQNKTNICRVEEAVWSEETDLLVFRITADRFLRNMVRAIVGTLIEVGENKISIQEFEHIIESQDRQKAGYSVPAKGLFLNRVEYDRSNWNLIEKR